MLDIWVILFISLAYVGLLFGIAYYGDNRAKNRSKLLSQPVIYSLSLAVYCTSWTFYGSVSRATQGWEFLSIYLGPILLFIFGWGMVYKIILVAKQENLTTIADFIASRYGKSRSLAIVITFMATLGILPYIALQLKAVAQSFTIMVSNTSNANFESSNTALVVAILMAAFAILFGTRQIDTSEHHRGMVLAVAFESVIKLIAFAAVGLFVIYGLFDGLGDMNHFISRSGMQQKLENFNPLRISFLTETLLAMLAMLCLPRQFQVGIVENNNPNDLHTARWLFPLYLVIFCIFMLPIAAAGNFLFSGQHIATDTYVLMIPLSQGAHGLATLAYIGGLSAATGMVIVATVSISTMISNDIIMPVIFHLSPLQASEDKNIGRLLLRVRRVVIIAMLLAAYWYFLLIGDSKSLVSLGLTAFVAVAQFAPALIGAVFWRGGNRYGALAGLGTGFSIWLYTLMVPNLSGLGFDTLSLVEHGLFGLNWLRPTSMFGLNGFDPITHATLLSLVLNIAAFVGVSYLTQARLQDRIQADHFVDLRSNITAPSAETYFENAQFSDLQTLCERFLGANRTHEAFHQFTQAHNRELTATTPIDQTLAIYAERLLAGVIGASSARIIVSSSLQGTEMQLGDVVSIVDEASAVFKFNRSMLQSTIEHVDQGISVVDKDMRLVVWNHRYQEMFNFPDGLITIGRPIVDVIRHNALNGDYGPGELEQQIKHRLNTLQQGTTHTHLRYRSDGAVFEVRGNAMPGGGYVNTYMDITNHKRTEAALKETNETLEQRVADRTKALVIANDQLSRAKTGADQANQSKTRFLAAASHDLMQPLNAARLFSSSLSQQHPTGELSATLHHLDDSLGAAEELITTLIEISKLDAGSLPPKFTHFPIDQMLQKLAAEFTLLCHQKQIQFHYVPCQITVYSDEQHLRRIVQNFLTNALRYTPKGKIVLGCRHRHNALEVQVWDTGIGIAPQKLSEVFEEFKRLDHPATQDVKGLGLGLAIADRIAKLLDQPIVVKSWQGKGSLFGIIVPIGERQKVVPKAAPQHSYAGTSTNLTNIRVLCIDNEASILLGMEQLLKGWGCKVITAANLSQALRHLADADLEPDVILADYHLDQQQTGTGAIARIRQIYKRQIPAICITADRTEEVAKLVADEDAILLNKPLKPAALRATLSRLK
ncbi:MAG: PAS domain-containing hybrid sensor histidine kinase/response regulator [Gammaproteobacteria bacterium]|nr:PAS domain-containing hybrid sensor histidine kinase/response regulator [Gammaproteobacteria bacterium]